jgi:sigma-B regulation protein RsbU (phosphoserine phosphatase)
LALAWQIQASFIPEQLPDIPDWQLAAKLEPARQTSGDFFDIIPLPNNRFGILIGDVSGKGMGAALFMAVSRTLLRTYLVDFHTRPELAFRVANGRILMDTHTDLFVTVFFGVIDPLAGSLTYCNAGHNAPLLLQAQDDAVQSLGRTGLPLGLSEDSSWEQKTIQMEASDVLVLYTDGITDAEDRDERYFGRDRLIKTVQANAKRPAQAILDALITEVHTFMGTVSQFDDIALVVLVRDGPRRQKC